MNLIVFGVNHKTAPVEVREKLAIPEELLGDGLRTLQEREPEILEKVILSTCNRMEIYATVSDVDGGVNSLKNFFHGYYEIDYALLDSSIYVKKVEDVVKIGERVQVKLVKIDNMGRYDFSMKALMEKPSNQDSK